MEARGRSSRRRWVAGGLGLLAAAMLFAPVLSVGWCVDFSIPGNSSCETLQRSIVGIETNPWLWLGASVVLAPTGMLFARPVR